MVSLFAARWKELEMFVLCSEQKVLIVGVVAKSPKL